MPVSAKRDLLNQDLSDNGSADTPLASTTSNKTEARELSIPVNRKVLHSVSDRFSAADAYASSYHWPRLEMDFDRFTSRAVQLVSAETKWQPAEVEFKAGVITRREWVDVNVGSMQRMLAPLASKMTSSNSLANSAAGVVYGAQLGTLLGWMSSRVLGQYDLLINEDDSEGDAVYYVGPNILEVEKSFGFPPEQFRLWIALHEVTHRMQFTSVPWMMSYFRDMTKEFVAGMKPSLGDFANGMRKLSKDIKDRKDPLAKAGVAGIMMNESQQKIYDKMQGLMALLEGHGDVIMNRAGLDYVPQAQRFARVLEQRRGELSGFGAWLSKLVGIEAKLKQYEMGERFIEEVELAGGSELMNRVWERSENLPTWTEIASPELWIKRIGSES